MPLIQRLRDSKKDCKVRCTAKDLFIRGHINDLDSFDICLLEIIDIPSHALFLEEYWIHQLKSWGFTLLNKYKVYPAKRLQRRDLHRYIQFGIKAIPFTPKAH